MRAGVYLGNMSRNAGSLVRSLFNHKLRAVPPSLVLPLSERKRRKHRRAENDSAKFGGRRFAQPFSAHPFFSFSV